MAAGCKNPRAINYDPTANPDNGTCVYMLKKDEVCHWFEDIAVENAADQSFTLSYSIAGQCWVFFHDYFPDMYIHTRKKLYNAKDSRIFEHHAGNPGWYHQPVTEGNTAKSFFIDVVFQGAFNLTLETVNWITEYLNNAGTDQ
ncbi:MAG TPA: hypothetical protein V6C65_09385, partial [Allocoleopsis sp.]